MVPKVSHKVNHKEDGDNKIEKPKGHHTMSNKKLFINLELEQEQKEGLRLGRIGNIIKELNDKTCLQYEYFQFMNRYGQIRTSWQTWKSLIKNLRLGYNLDENTLTLDDGRWDDMIKVKSMLYLFL